MKILTLFFIVMLSLSCQNREDKLSNGNLNYYAHPNLKLIDSIEIYSFCTQCNDSVLFSLCATNTSISISSLQKPMYLKYKISDKKKADTLVGYLEESKYLKLFKAGSDNRTLIVLYGNNEITTYSLFNKYFIVNDSLIFLKKNQLLDKYLLDNYGKVCED